MKEFEGLDIKGTNKMGMTKKEKLAHNKKSMVQYLNLENNEQKEIYAIIRHVAKSGELRYISFKCNRHYKSMNETYLEDITHSIGEILGLSYSEKHRALKVRGCGMDMAFHTIYNLSAELYDEDGYKLKSRII